jgi:hypothetical protein
MTKQTPPVVAQTTVESVHFQGERRYFYAPRWFRRQNKGKTFRAFARELYTDCVKSHLMRNNVPLFSLPDTGTH